MKDQQLALHGLAIKKHGDAGEVATITGLETARAQSFLDEAVKAGRAVKAGAKYMLTPVAQVALKSGYRRDFSAERADPAMNKAYDDFERINEQLKQLITDWQTLDVGGQKVPNNHSDKAYDAKVIEKLGDLHERAEPMLDRLAAGLARLRVYRGLLQSALEKAEDGDIAWVSDARCMSYHTVWFELHEDLIRILGRTRVE
jgi:hypothetical protein